MDFEYTSEERKITPVWSQDQDMAEPPRKRPLAGSVTRISTQFADHGIQGHSRI